MPIESASELFVAKGEDLRHWHNVSSDIIKYLRDKIDRSGEAVVYKGTLENMAAFGPKESTASHGDVWTNQESGVNMMWNGEGWVPVSLFRMDFDREPVDGSINAIQSGYIWTALQNVITEQDIIEILQGIDSDQELQTRLESISNRLADIMQDLQDLNNKFNSLPDPLISTDVNNQIVYGNDRGLYCSTVGSVLEQRVDRLETLIGSEPVVITPNGEPISVTPSSPSFMFIDSSEDLTFTFEPAERLAWDVKHIYIEALDRIRLTFVNSTFSNQSEDPHWGQAGFGILLRCSWVAGKVVIEVLDNSQSARNVEEWMIGGGSSGSSTNPEPEPDPNPEPEPEPDPNPEPDPDNPDPDNP